MDRAAGCKLQRLGLEGGPRKTPDPLGETDFDAPEAVG
jgi:hypothetical protein